jgi:mRNA-degrading endonuclease YafQ of YafQ-DinJ toxin-antitoxin module
LKRFQSCLDYTESPDNTQVKHWSTEINEFSSFIRKAKNLLKEIKERTKEMITAKEAMNTHYKNLTKMATKYEDHNLKEYWDGLHTR